MLQFKQVDMTEKISSPIASISPDLLWGLLAGVLFIFLMVSFIFEYHWNHYGVNKNIKRFAQTLFWLVSVILILIMAVALFAFDTTQ